jgi:deoxycytidine triphosphate deaminase
MGVLVDWQIRQRVRDYGMIEPFTDYDSCPPGVISYGLSSMGYDLRIGTRFKVYSDARPTVVDPKRIDVHSYINIETEEPLPIPPNSYVLGESVELFRIPRDILVTIIGRSTYARCFSGDTRVTLLDGTAPTLEELADRGSSGEPFWGYGISALGRIEAVYLDTPRYFGTDRLMEVGLDNGERIRCTPGHRFILRDGRTLETAKLRLGTSLMPLYTREFRGYEGVWQPLTRHFEATHRLADEWNLRYGIYEAAPGQHRHHVDEDPRNNDPRNIIRMSAAEHNNYHKKRYGVGWDGKAFGRRVSEAHRKKMKDPAYARAYSEMCRAKAQRVWDLPQYEEVRGRLRAAFAERAASQEFREAARARMLARYAVSGSREAHGQLTREAWAGDDSRRQAQAKVMHEVNVASGRFRSDITEETVHQALLREGSIRGAARFLGCDRSVFRRFPEVVASTLTSPSDNHKVISIRDLPGEHDVFCPIIPEAGNFALQAGVFVNNSCIFVNMTPGEPEWVGVWTLEISNPTRLPTLIYPNEGIAQAIFYRADNPERLCDRSYADKKGKYQNQSGVTLPIVR